MKAGAWLPALALLASVSGCLFEGKGGGTETESNLVEGRALNHDGNPAPFARVSVRPTDYLADLVSSERNEAGIVDTVTDAQGRLRLSGLPAGQYRIEMAGGEAYGSIHDFALPESGLGLALDPDTLKPRGSIAGAIAPDSDSHVAGFVQVFGMERLVQADPQGGFVLYNLPEGVYDVRLSSLQPFRREAILRGIKVLSGQRTRLDAVTLAQEAKLVFRADTGGLRITGLDSTNPVIYDNERWDNGPDDEFVWAKASAGSLDLRGNIVTRDFHGQSPVEVQLRKARQELLEARLAGFANLPEITPGAMTRLSWPASGKLEDIPVTASPGSDLIVSEARKATPEKPLVVVVGGPLTTVAQAWLTDPSIAPRMVVAGAFSYMTNPEDTVANYLVARKCRFVQWGRNYFWAGKADTSLIRAIPASRMGERVRGYLFANSSAPSYGDLAPLAFLFRRSLWTRADIVKVTRNLDVRPASDITFDFVDIPASANDWIGYQDVVMGALADARAYHPYALPGRLEGEGFVGLGRGAGSIMDTTAGTGFATFPDGGYAEYKVSGADSVYQAVVRYRSGPGAKAQFALDGGPALAELVLPAVADWSETAPSPLSFPAGEHVLRVTITGGPAFLDWIDAGP